MSEPNSELPLFRLHLPAVSAGNGTPLIQPQQPEPPAHPVALALIALMRDDVRQRRAELVADARLMAAAKDRAHDMVHRGYFDHVDPDGLWPNDYARERGYRLPGYYLPGANNIESIVSHAKDAAEAWREFMGSEPHERHLLGLHEFWAQQTRVGVGVGTRESGLMCVVVMTAPVEE